MDWQRRRVTFPAAIMKAIQTLVLPMPDVVVEHLQAFEIIRDFVFEYSASRAMFRRDFCRLQPLAGLPP